MEHTPSPMTHITIKNISRKAVRLTYKVATFMYIIYFLFSSQALAEKVQAPHQYSAEELARIEPTDLKDVDDRVLKIKKYYDRYDLPLAEYAEEFVAAADKYDIDWRLLAAIGFIESTGGKHACETATYSPFGWGSCNIDFDSYEDAIDTVSRNLGGHNPNTAHYYQGKDLSGILYAYNSVIPDYEMKIVREMSKIQTQEV